MSESGVKVAITTKVYRYTIRNPLAVGEPNRWWTVAQGEAALQLHHDANPLRPAGVIMTAGRPLR